MSGWLARRRESIRAHEELWTPERVTGDDGLSHFQRRAEAALVQAGVSLHGRTVKQLSGGEPTDLYIDGITGRANARVLIYQDGIEIQSGTEVLRFEDWDTESPDHMISILVDALVEFASRAG